MCSKKTCVKKRYMTTGNDIHYPSQTNHDACYIPECVRQYVSEPLYIIVAQWCMQQQDWVQRNHISEAFHITARRASYLIAYLRNKATRVDCASRQVIDSKVICYEIYVKKVSPPPETLRQAHLTTPSLTRLSTSQANELWSQLLSSRNAGNILKNKG
ncbi:CaiF/GrlA family transcriptional regulator [Salmonella enterica subsp. enterica]|nr:CaiF/GrlA family transcriptional regulator [Salmonella enterica subsp. enterica serovar Baildon]